MHFRTLILIIGIAIFTSFTIKDDKTTINQINHAQQMAYNLSKHGIKTREFLTKKEKIDSFTDTKEWFLAYRKLLKDYSDWYNPLKVEDVYTYEEIYLMQRCIETETFGSKFDAKCNVASVIFNRLKSDDFPNTVNKVIVPGQFAFHRKNITEDTKLALEYAFMVGDTTNGALFFHSNPKSKTFNNAKYLFTDGVGHHFYK